MNYRAAGHDMQYERPSFEKLEDMPQNRRAGIFTLEYETKHTFNEAGEVISRTVESDFEITLAAFDYAKEQEALFQKELAAKNNSSPNTPQP